MNSNTRARKGQPSDSSSVQQDKGKGTEDMENSWQGNLELALREELVRVQTRKEMADDEITRWTRTRDEAMAEEARLQEQLDLWKQER